MPPLNIAYKDFCATQNYGFVDLFKVAPEWEKMWLMGYADRGNTVHENGTGGILFAEAIFSHAFENYCAIEEKDEDPVYTPYTPFGTSGRATYFDRSTSISSSNDIYLSSSGGLGIYAAPAKGELSVKKTSGVGAELGTISGGFPWFSVNDVAGNASLNWFNYWNGSNWKTSGGGIPRRLYNNTSRAFGVQSMFGGYVPSTSDSTFSFTDLFYITDGGQMYLPKYISSSSFVGAAQGIIGFTNSGAVISDAITMAEDSFNLADDNQVTFIGSSASAGAPIDNAFGMLVPYRGTTGGVNWQIAGLATGADALRMWIRAKSILGATNWRRIGIWKDGEDAGSIDVSAPGDNVLFIQDTNSVNTINVVDGAITPSKLATGAVTGAVYGTVYYVPVDSIDYNATTDLATYSEIHYYMYTGAGATANQVLTVPAASITYAGKKIWVVSDDADGTDAYSATITSASGSTIRYYSGGSTGMSDNASYGFSQAESSNAVLLVCIQNPRTLDYRWVVYDGVRTGY